jgi:uncharacterized protein (TIGR02145 family)
MKKIKIFLVAIVMIAGYTLTAQVSISTDGDDPDGSAMLDVQSTEKGFLPPRMTKAQIEAITSPANGLIVFSTTDDKFYAYVLDDNEWKEIAYGTGKIILPASYTIGSGGACVNTTLNGNYYTGLVLDGSNMVILDATVTTKGLYSITTNTLNGYNFSGTGAFSSTGTVQVTLYGSGTPGTEQTDNFTATADNSGGTCAFSVAVSDPPSIIEVTNLTTGKTWMDRNLGASRAATSSNDVEAYGDIYQWGRYTEGHEIRTSTTTPTNATTAVPNDGNSWDGKFITENSGPYDWLTSQDNTLWQGEGGTNNPCPSGFRIPTDAEWEAERLSWTTNDAAGAFGSVLKLTVGGYRYYSTGGPEYVGSYGYYWSSSVLGTAAKDLRFTSSDAYVTDNGRAFGLSVRCIKE